MKSVIPTLILFYTMVNIYNVEGSVEKITYRCWNDCYLITNDSTRVVINASAGGRIMVYERNGINVIYEDYRQDGKLLADYLIQGFDPDGGRFDYGQELITRNLHSLTYMGPWNGEVLGDYSLKITSQPDEKLGLQSTRIFTLDPKSSYLMVSQIMTNISDKETSYFFWGRTLVKLGGKIFMPVNPDSRFPDKWGRYIWGEPVLFESDPIDPGIMVTDSFFTLIPDKAGNQKYGNDSKAGWMAYGYQGLLYIKKYGFFPEKQYGEHYGQTNVFYTNKKTFAEMEPVSPVANLMPGESYTYNEDWYLFEYPEASASGFSAKTAAAFVVQKTAKTKN